MTGAQLKSKAIKAYGTFKWRKLMAEFLECNPSTVWRYAQSAQVPNHIADKVAELKLKKWPD